MANIVSMRRPSSVIGFFVMKLSASITPITLFRVLRGTVTNSSRFREPRNLASPLFGVFMVKGVPFIAVRAITPEFFCMGIFIDFTILFSLDFFKCSSWLCGSMSWSSPSLCFSICDQTFPASSSLSGPIPILPSRLFSFSFRRKSMALLKLRPTCDVTAVRII